MDEARVGLIPSYRAMWAKKGHRPTASSRRRYQWRYDYAFVHPASGRMVNFVWSSVDSEVMSLVLERFATEVDAGPHRHIVLVLDGAGWHTSKTLVIPEGIHLVFLPPYSPELQPAEKLFPLVNEALANRLFKSIDELVEVLCVRLRTLQADPFLISGHTFFHWWPRDIQPQALRVAS